MDDVNVNGINSDDTKKLVEALLVLASTTEEMKDEIKAVLNEMKVELQEIKAKL